MSGENTKKLLDRPRFLTFLKWEAWLALLAGAAAFLYSIKTPARLWQIGDAFANFSFDHTLERPTPFDYWVAPFPLFPLLAILLWLQGALFLFFLKKPPVTDNEVLATRWKVSRATKIAVGGGLVVILAIAWLNRSSLLLPNAAGQLPASDFDEMVYYQGAALIAQGNLPYRDFFLAHPPLVELIYGLALKLTPANNAGGLDSFLFLRWLAIGLGLLTVLGVFWSANRLWAQASARFAFWPGLAAAGLYAADVRAAGVATLETPSNFFAVAGLVCFLESSRLKSQRWRTGLLIASGTLLAFATLCKLPGLAAVFAVGALLLFQRNWAAFLRLCTGLVGGSLLVLAPLAIFCGPGEIVRQLFFFQLLRPQEVAAGKDQIGRLADFPQSALTVWIAGLGLLWLTARLLRPGPNKPPAAVLLPILWSAPLLFLLITNKSFHPWYFVQWALPLALLGSGLLTIRLPRLSLKLAASLVGLLLVFPFFWTQLAEAQRPTYDKVYLPSAAVIPPNQPVLVFDPGYSFMSAAQPVRLPGTTKYLVDSAGYMVYLNLEMDKRSLPDLLQTGLFGSRERGQERVIFEKERAQALIVEGISQAAWVALDGKLGLPQITPRTAEFIGGSALLERQIEHVTIYKVRPLEVRRVWSLSNGLQLTPFGLATSVWAKANADPVKAGEVLTISAQQSAQRTLEVRLVWRVTQPPKTSFKVFVHVLDSADNKIAQRDIVPQDGQADPTRWQPGDAYQDVHSLPLPAELAAGRYKVVLGFYEAGTNERILISGQPALILGALEVQP